MIRINLLPHREMRRKQQQQQFLIALGVVAAIGVAIWFGVHTYLDGQFDNQKARNKYLDEEIVKLDKQIDEIRKLKEQTASLLARKQVVETLQGNRAETVNLLEQLVRQLPDGVYLRNIRQQGQRLTINGYTQSQARVSTLMRNLESSRIMENPSLVEIKAATVGGSRISEFIMNINIARQVEQQGNAPPPPAKK